jgi:transcriptional regulator with XRE-family HTH domain
MTRDNRIGEKITTLRESLGLSVDDLAERSGCDSATIVGLESGQVAASLAPLIKLTRALGVRLGTLLDDESELGPIVTRRNEA